MKFTVVAATICTVVVAFAAGILRAVPLGGNPHAVVWIRWHPLENESITLFDNGRFEAQFAFDIRPPLRASGAWHERQDLKTEKIIALLASDTSDKFSDSYRHLFVRVLEGGEEVLVPGADVAAFDAGERFSESRVFHRQAAAAVH